MKKVITLIIIVLVSTVLTNAQEKKNSFFIEHYQPIQTPSLREFYNDEWILTPSNEYKRHYFSNSFGIGYERVIGKNLIIRPRIGVTIRNLSEANSTDVFFNGVQDVGFNEEYKYKQKHINIFLGLAKRTEIHQNINVDFGFELSHVRYLHGETTYHSKYEYYITNTAVQHGSDERWTTHKVGKAYVFGIGPYIKPEYHFKNDLFISMEIQIYFSMSYSNDRTLLTDKKITKFAAINGGVPYLDEADAEWEIKYDFRQWSWTRVSPLIRFGYKF